MKHVYLSDSGPKVSEAIYGFWRWKDQGNDTVARMEKTVNLCLELGINSFDHADSYGNFTIEKYFGEIIKNKSFRREDIVLFSKCGISASSRGFTYYDSSAEHIITSVKQFAATPRYRLPGRFLIASLRPFERPGIYR
jgi:predicted oxidoreductase